MHDGEREQREGATSRGESRGCTVGARERESAEGLEMQHSVVRL
jgi:hypothetical protein